MLSLIVVSAALLHVGSAAAIVAISKTDVKTTAGQDQNIRVGENAQGQVVVQGLSVSQVQDIINDATSSASSGGLSLSIPAI